MSEHVTDSGQVGRETVLRSGGSPIPVLPEGTAPYASILAEGTAPYASILAEGTAPYAIVRPGPAPGARRVWPWIAGAVVLATAAFTGYVLLAQRSERAAFEERFPIVVDRGDRLALDADAERWNRGTPRLLAALSRFSPPPLDTLTGAGACPLAIDDATDVATSDDPDAAVLTRMIVVPGESLDGLDVIARDEIDRMIAASERGRFRTDEGKSRVLRAIHGAFVVAIITEHTLPGIDRDGAARTGSAAGVAYGFDPASGALRCAGSFRTTASEATFEASTIHAISASLRAID